MQETLKPLEAHLASRTFVAGNALSLADLVVAADLRPAFQQVRMHSDALTLQCPT